MHLLITGAWREAPHYLKRLSKEGYEIAFLQNEMDGLNACLDETGEKLVCSLPWPEGIICNSLFLYHPLHEFQNLKYIQLTSAGFDRVNENEARKRKIILRNAKGVYSIPMAEFALHGVLSLYKNNRGFGENQKEHLWKKERNLRELTEKIVLIIGCGSVGVECAKRFRACGCHIIGANRTKRRDANFDEIVAVDELDSVFPKADIIILSLALTKETEHLINNAYLRTVKQGTILVNISRGAVVDTAALIESLQDKKLYGAVLDVFEEEPLDTTSPLWDMRNVVITPHISFESDKSQHRLSNLILRNIEKYKLERKLQE